MLTGAFTQRPPHTYSLTAGEAGRLMLLTGPNASGKTVYLRTVALIVYLAHIGSFVPAEAATVSRTDAILSRMHSKESASVWRAHL